jgi:hypothetical protein
MMAYNQAVHDSIPKRKRKGKTPPWMKRSIKQTVKEKRKLWRKYTKSSKETDHTQFVNKRNETKSQIRAAKVSYEEKLARNIKEDSKSFFATSDKSRRQKQWWDLFRGKMERRWRAARKQPIC